jgi:hypothetical protein
MLKLLIKVGVSALALMLAAQPVAACVLPGAEDGRAVRGHGDGEIASLL